MPYIPPYRRRDGTPVRGHPRGNPRRGLGQAAVASAIGFAVFLNGMSVGPGSSTLGRGVPRLTHSQVQVRFDTHVMKFTRATLRWERKGYKVKVVNRAAIDFDCSTHSYGQVQDFFLSDPCDLLTRTVFELRDRHRNVLLVAISWVDMPSVGSAENLLTLVDKYGTGNVTELSRESGPYRRIRYTGKIYDSTREGSAVGNVQVQPVVLWPLHVALDEITDGALQ